MEYVIVYFSGTGNTQLIANEIKKRLDDKSHSVELISIENEKEWMNNDFDNKVIGFGYPVYKFSYPDIFNRFFPVINRLASGQKYFQFSTFTRFEGYALNDFSQRLDDDRYHLIGERAFKAPSCGISCRKPIDNYEYESVMFFEDSIHKKLDAFVEDIVSESLSPMQRKTKKRIRRGFKKILVKDIEKTKYPRIEIDQEQCILCGLCAKKCPDNNLIQLQKGIGIFDETDCLHCLRCMNHCPVNAITFGELTQGDNQYTLKVRDALYEKASQGYRERYWSEFNAVIKKWQRKTIKYWLTHRFRRV